MGLLTGDALRFCVWKSRVIMDVSVSFSPQLQASGRIVDAYEGIIMYLFPASRGGNLHWCVFMFSFLFWFLHTSCYTYPWYADIDSETQACKQLSPLNCPPPSVLLNSVVRDFHLFHAFFYQQIPHSLIPKNSKHSKCYLNKTCFSWCLILRLTPPCYLSHFKSYCNVK